jgi:hypothetical protein
MAQMIKFNTFIKFDNNNKMEAKSDPYEANKKIIGRIRQDHMDWTTKKFLSQKQGELC